MRTIAAVLFFLSGAALFAADDALDKDIEDNIEIIVTGQQFGGEIPKVSLTEIGSRNVFGPEQIRETGARDLNDLVVHIPALSTRPYNGGEASAPSFSMRGLPDDGLTEYVNVLIDGVPASPLPYGWTAFSFLPLTPDRLFAIDYIRGGHSVRYSPNTVGGILNLITQPVPAKPEIQSRTTVGDFGFLSQLVSVGGHSGDVGVAFAYVNRRGDGYRDGGGFAQEDFNAKAVWDIADDRWLAVSFSYMENGHRAPGGLTQAQFDAGRYANARPENGFTGTRTVFDAVYHSDGDSGQWWEGFLYVSKTFRHLRAQRPHFGVPATISDWVDDSWFFGVGARVQRKYGDHTIYAGGRYQREWIPSWKLASEPFPGGAGTLTQDAEYTLDTLSFHIDDTWKPTEDLTVVLGVRLEWIPTAEGSDPIAAWSFDDDFFVVLPGVGVSYAVTSNTAVFANYFEGFRAPQVWGFGSTTGSGSLELERGRSVEVGARALNLHGITAAITGWRTEYDDFGVFYTGLYENLGRIVAIGVDIEIEWAVPGIEGLTLIGSLTLQDSELKSGPNAGNETPYAWSEKAAWRARYERDGFVISIGGTFVGKSFSDEANTAAASADGTLGVNPSRILWDARVAKHFKLGDHGRVEIAVGATNLLDKQWFVHSRGGFFGGGVVSGSPRQAYASFQLVMNW